MLQIKGHPVGEKVHTYHSTAPFIGELVTTGDPEGPVNTAFGIGMQLATEHSQSHPPQSFRGPSYSVRAASHSHQMCRLHHMYKLVERPGTTCSSWSTCQPRVPDLIWIIGITAKVKRVIGKKEICAPLPIQHSQLELGGGIPRMRNSAFILAIPIGVPSLKPTN